MRAGQLARVSSTRKLQLDPLYGWLRRYREAFRRPELGLDAPSHAALRNMCAKLASCSASEWSDAGCDWHGCTTCCTFTSPLQTLTFTLRHKHVLLYVTQTEGSPLRRV